MAQLLTAADAGAVGLPKTVPTPISTPTPSLLNQMLQSLAGALQQAKPALGTPAAIRLAYDHEVAPTLVRCRYDAVRQPFEGFFKPGAPPAQRHSNAPIGTIVYQSVSPGGAYTGPGTLTVAISSSPSPTDSAVVTGVGDDVACPPACTKPTPIKTTRPVKKRCPRSHRRACASSHGTQDSTVAPTGSVTPAPPPPPPTIPWAWALLLVPLLTIAAWSPLKRLWHYLLPPAPLPLFSAVFSVRHEKVAVDHAPFVVEPSFAVGVNWAGETVEIDGLAIVSDRIMR